MTRSDAAFWMTLLGTGCWGACFVWMWRISVKQNFLLDRLTDQARRIEKLSKIEHDLIKEVHPQVGEIREGLEEVIASVKENTEEIAAAAQQNADRARSVAGSAKVDAGSREKER